MTFSLEPTATPESRQKYAPVELMFSIVASSWNLSPRGRRPRMTA